MHQILPTEHDDVMAIRLTGEVTKTEYDSTIPVFEDKIRRHGKISVYLELDLFEGWTPGALMKEIKYDIKHAQHLKRVALVGDQGILSWASTFAKPFTSAEIKHFPMARREEAWQWVGAGS